MADEQHGDPPPKSDPGAMRTIGALSAVGIAFVLAVVIGFAIGYLLDHLTGLTPLFTILFFFFGLAAGILNVVRTASADAREREHPDDGSNTRLPLIVIFLLAGASLVTAVATPGTQDRSLAFLHDAGRRAMLERWATAVAGHRVGTFDAYAATLSGWSSADLQAVVADTVTIARAVASHSPAEGVMRRDISALLHLTDEQAHAGNVNPFLKRGALLCLDLAITSPPTSAPSGASPKGRVAIVASDGQTTGIRDVAIHINLGRALLEAVMPAPGKDETVRLWYVAAGTFLEGTSSLGEARTHLERALDVFADDGDVLFLAGCLDEAMASPGIQAAARTARIPRGYRPDVQTPEWHLVRAEALLNRAAKQQPDAAEVRLHLGHVRGLLGRHKQAAEDLRSVRRGTADALRLYYSDLFLGGEEEALGDRPAAREAYRRAAELCPFAQSPYLALSRLAAAEGREEDARHLLERIWSMPDDESERPDPWWRYYVAHARDIGTVLERLRAPFLVTESR